MRFITLTYYKEANLGSSGKATTKTFEQNVNMINRITEYNNSTKLDTADGTLEVVETKHEIIGKIMSAQTI